MAQAVCRLHPGAKYAIGPPIQDGFYYDFDLPAPLSRTTCPRSRRGCGEIVAADQPFIREEVTRDDALARLADQPYKGEIIEGMGDAEVEVRSAARIASAVPQRRLGRPVLGPHVPSTGRLGAFRLTSTRRRVLARRRAATRC